MWVPGIGVDRQDTAASRIHAKHTSFSAAACWPWPSTAVVFLYREDLQPQPSGACLLQRSYSRIRNEMGKLIPAETHKTVLAWEWNLKQNKIATGLPPPHPAGLCIFRETDSLAWTTWKDIIEILSIQEMWTVVPNGCFPLILFPQFWRWDDPERRQMGIERSGSAIWC